MIHPGPPHIDHRENHIHILPRVRRRGNPVAADHDVAVGGGGLGLLGLFGLLCLCLQSIQDSLYVGYGHIDHTLRQRILVNCILCLLDRFFGLFFISSRLDFILDHNIVLINLADSILLIGRVRILSLICTVVFRFIFVWSARLSRLHRHRRPAQPRGGNRQCGAERQQ